MLGCAGHIPDLVFTLAELVCMAWVARIVVHQVSVRSWKISTKGPSLAVRNFCHVFRVSDCRVHIIHARGRLLKPCQYHRLLNRWEVRQTVSEQPYNSPIIFSSLTILELIDRLGCAKELKYQFPSICWFYPHCLACRQTAQFCRTVAKFRDINVDDAISLDSAETVVAFRYVTHSVKFWRFHIWSCL